MQFFPAHGSGRLRLRYATAGGAPPSIVTCGTDGKVRTAPVHKPGEAFKVASNRDDAPIYALAVHPGNDAVATGDEAAFVKSHTHPELDLDGVVTRMTLPVRELAYSPSGSILAVAGDGDAIKLVDTTSKKVFRQLRPAPSTRGLAYDPEGQLVAVVSANGQLQIWDIAESKPLKKKPAVARKVGPSNNSLGISWHPDGGNLLAVPGQDNDVIYFERLSWNEAGSLRGVHTGPVNVAIFCPNGLYVATAGEDKLLAIWDASKMTCIFQKQVPDAVTDLAWHPTENELSCVTEAGEVGVWRDVIPPDLTGPAAQVEHVEADMSMKDNILADDVGDPDASDAIDQLFEVDDLEDDVSDIVRPAKRHKAEPAVSPNSLLPQKPIQPGSTPEAHDGNPFFLCFNEIGRIVMKRMEGQNAVQVDVKDSSLMPVRIPVLTDYFGFTLGALSERGAVYASPRTASCPSTIVYRHFNSWTTNSDWSVGLPEDDEAMCLAAGTAFVAVATSQCLLRVWSPHGVQLQVIALSGTPVALAAHKSQLAVVWHGPASGLSCEQNLICAVYDLTTEQQVNCGRLPLSARSSLSWLGFSTDGVLAAYDSHGVLRIQGHGLGAAWVPIFNASRERKGSEHFWLVGLDAVRVRCVVCPGQTPHPVVKPGPIISEFRLFVPAAQVQDATLAQLESDCIISRTFNGRRRAMAMECGREAGADGIDKDLDRGLLKLFNHMLKNDRQGRALELVAVMNLDETIGGALRLANHHQASTLAEKISQLLEQRALLQMDDVSEGLEEQIPCHDRENRPPVSGHLSSDVGPSATTWKRARDKSNGDPSSIPLSASAAKVASVLDNSASGLKSATPLLPKGNPFARKT
eukprot:evm.model.scf_11.1 EVM.evm.TU.scf_11.1   scf_11:136-8515(+)